VVIAALQPSVAPRDAPSLPGAGLEALPSFEQVYEQYFDLVFRNIRRLGVPDGMVDDGVQEVFLVVHRRLGDFEGRSSLKTWVLSIVARVAKDCRRSVRRKGPVETDALPDVQRIDPQASAERSEAIRVLYRLLEALDDDKRAVLVMAELEQQTAAEIASILGENVNTIQARLRAARREFEQAALREQARDEWRLR
jgi:RNA polymerase sigma-70 factor (ECF subfamily)